MLLLFFVFLPGRNNLLVTRNEGCTVSHLLVWWQQTGDVADVPDVLRALSG